MIYIFLAVVWLTTGDPPDTTSQPFPTQQACEDFATQFGTAVQTQGGAGVASVMLTCVPVSNPVTEKSS